MRHEKHNNLRAREIKFTPGEIVCRNNFVQSNASIGVIY